MLKSIYLLQLTANGFQNWTTSILAFDFERMKGAKKRTTNENRWMHDGKLPKLSVIRSRSKWKIFSCKLVSICFVVIVLVVACAEIILNTSHAHFLWFKLSWISKKTNHMSWQSLKNKNLILNRISCYLKLDLSVYLRKSRKLKTIEIVSLLDIFYPRSKHIMYMYDIC